MSSKKMDPKLLASEENKGSELKTICKRFKIKIKDLRAILKEEGQNGKPEHSMEEVKAALIKRGYTYHPAKKRSIQIPEDTEAPELPPSEIYVTS
jgi:hypothetical protein